MPDTEGPAPTEALGGQTRVRPDGPIGAGRVTAPIVVDLGKQRRRAVKELLRGEGALMNEVNAIVRDLRSELGDDLGDKILVPLVIVCRRKRGRRQTVSPP